MNKIKISNHQLTVLTTGLVFGSAPLFISSSVAVISRQDAWLSAIISIIIGLVVVWINTCLGGLYPDKTFMETIPLLLGKWLGGLVCLFIILVVLVAASQITWYVGDFITTLFSPEMSAYPINFLFMAVVVIALLYGTESFFRSREIIFTFLFPFFIISMLFLIPNIKQENLLPIMENGIAPVIKGAIPLMSFTVFPAILLNMFYPVNVEDIKGAKKAIFKGYLLGMLISFIAIIMCILVLGSTITANLRYPLVMITKQIDIGVIFSRLEALILIIWLGTNLTASFVYLYTGAVGLTTLLKLEDYKKIVLPLALIIGVYSDFIYKDIPYEINWDSYVWPPCIFTVGVILPIILLVISFIKKCSRNTRACGRRTL